jgi:hypothetical protein
MQFSRDSMIEGMNPDVWAESLLGLRSTYFRILYLPERFDKNVRP